ncbi:SpoVG family protein [Oscillospiraceae bacterium OttesenSCG-928-G22]|nr:SpoVG family protein [Oscillospiraceae bacterium OttesenSCG-928-G22]
MAKKSMTPADEGIQAAREQAQAAREDADRAVERPDISVEITKLMDPDEGKTRAYGKLKLFGFFELDGVRIVEGQNGLFCSMPARKGQDGNYYPLARITDDDFKTLINDAAVGAYQAQLLEQQQAPPKMAEPEMSL